jgi:hypothetical protein
VTVYRVRQTTLVTLTHTFTVDETPTDATGPVTVTVARLDGTTVTSGTATHGAAGSGTYTFDLPAQPAPDILTVRWTGTVAGASVTVTDAAEIVGGFIYETADLRNRYKLDATKYPAQLLAERRIQVEQDIEAIIGHALVPRFARVRVDGSSRDAMLVSNERGPLLYLRSIRAASIAGTALVGSDLTGLITSDSGVVYRPSYTTWPLGRRNTILEVEYGLDYPPEPVRAVAMEHARNILGQVTSHIPDRAISYTIQDGGVYRLAVPAADTTGVPAIDSVLHRYRKAPGGFA